MYDAGGQPGELFITMSKEGSTIGGLMDSLGTAISVALQYGVPIESLVTKFAHQRFEPQGMYTANRDIPFAKSLVDYIFRWMGMQFIEWIPRSQFASTSNIRTSHIRTNHYCQGGQPRWSDDTMIRYTENFFNDHNAYRVFYHGEGRICFNGDDRQWKLSQSKRRNVSAGDSIATETVALKSVIAESIDSNLYKVMHRHALIVDKLLYEMARATSV